MNRHTALSQLRGLHNVETEYVVAKTLQTWM